MESTFADSSPLPMKTDDGDERCHHGDTMTMTENGCFSIEDYYVSLICLST